MVSVLKVGLFTSLLVMLLSVGASAARRDRVRMLRCWEPRDCPKVPGEKPSAWSAEHEALYWRAVEILATQDACKGDRWSRRTAFQAERRMELSCKGTKRAIPWLEPGQKLESAPRDEIDHLTVFDKDDAMTVAGGIEVRFSVSSFFKWKSEQELRGEGCDFYAIIKRGRSIEIRYLTKLSM